MPVSNPPPTIDIEDVEASIEEALESYEPEQVSYLEVVVHADLPDAAEFTNETFIVLVGTGIFGINRKRAGIWRSNGTAWYRLGALEEVTSPGEGVVFSTPPVGCHRIYNIRRNAAGNIEYEYDTEPKS